MASSCGTDADKGSLRSHYLAFRKRLPSRVRDAADEGIARRVMGMPEVSAAAVVLSCVGVGSEGQTRPRGWRPLAWLPASRLPPPADALARAAGTTIASWPSIPVTRSVSAADSS